MFKTLGCLLTFILSIGMAIIVGAGIVFARLFGFFGKKNGTNNSRQYQRSQSDASSNSGSTSNSKTDSANPDDKHKLFDDSEGEYVEFEEMKKDSDQ